MKLNYEDLLARYDNMSVRMLCSCEFVTKLAGGVPADEAGISMFVKHHLKLEGEEAAKAVARILREEIGERPVPSGEGELQEKLSYGINVIRRTANGPYLGNWMIHACLKTAGSRIGLFAQKRGSKGDVVEAGKVSAHGISALDTADRVYLRGPDGTAAATYFESFKGRVQTPRGSNSIAHDSECVPPGTLFEFEFRFLAGKLTLEDAKDMLALSMIVGLGSVKSLGCGKFKILSAEVETAKGKAMEKIA